MDMHGPFWYLKMPLAKLVEWFAVDVSTVGLVYKPSSNWGVPWCTNPLVCLE